MAYVHTPYVCTDYVHSTLGLIVNMFTFSFTARVVMRSYFAIIIFYVCLLTEHFNKRKKREFMVNLGKTYWTLKLCRTAKSYQEPHSNCRHDKHNLYMMYVCIYVDMN